MTSPWTNHFLIAMPHMGDPNFFRTVTYICEHTPEGAMGIVINRPSELSMYDVFQQVGISAEPRQFSGVMVHLGGPVQANRGFVLHEPLGHWESTMAVTDRVGVSTSRDILDAIARNEGPERWLMALGYAGWGAGQLEREMAENAWLSGPAADSVLFETPMEARWHAAAHLLGVDLTLLSEEAGHA
ncbi:MAG TPA: YqgE/AlgH family protein [Acidiferrobacteraceae bacterium]|nr:YqgE/AlgH family protein [Acidiferrobacteraceae bacterium]